MDLLLEPPHGAGPVRLGMTLDEAVVAVSPWGEPRVRTRPNRVLVTVSTACDGVGVEVLLEDRDTVTAVELWWPGEGRETATRVLLDGVDVFRTPADELLGDLPARETAGDAPFVPGLSLGFTRRTSQEVPRRPDGLPVCFTSVLVGGEGYFDHRI
ncbi:hypothetical protein ABZY16_00660 [Streptomyces sp. NPDC006553]|uniref:hypothetical protein n=1 Tax=unclassified Streptomyces TaxID=2593676 RepID=UPI002251F168|nr:hypothetical protein [Streptomyces sp. NBC_00233]MCX5227275.1 hypothetical protein [Streptomyces sp. NBC_00233]